ncbi:hypothetical protein VAA_02576 [Vibrio anguillarum 775]|nr:hypothetical protein VAA_02576 [Vibrio anguillarum 775]
MVATKTRLLTIFLRTINKPDSDMNQQSINSKL